MPFPTPARGSTCLITGASSGIGAEFARQLAARGHNVLLVARREEPMRRLADELERAHGVKADVLPCDLSDAARRDRLIEQIVAGGLDVDVLVNNAGYSHAGDVHLNADAQLGMVEVNIEALVALTTAFLPKMVGRRRGAIINVGSMAGFQPLPAQATYAATKAFVVSFSEAISAEVRGSGVIVTALCPGPVRTEFYEVGRFKRAAIGPAFLWGSAAGTAAAGIAGAEAGRRIVVPGLGRRALAFTSRHSPHGMLLGPVAAVWRWAIGE